MNTNKKFCKAKTMIPVALIPVLITLVASANQHEPVTSASSPSTSYSISYQQKDFRRQSLSHVRSIPDSPNQRQNNEIRRDIASNRIKSAAFTATTTTVPPEPAKDFDKPIACINCGQVHSEDEGCGE